MTIQLKPVTWQVGRYASHRALIGQITIGAITWHMTSDQKDWVASTAYGAFTKDFDDEPDAKAWVERTALSYLGKIVECVP